MKSPKQVSTKALKIARLIKELSEDIANSTPEVKDAYRAYVEFEDLDFRLHLLKFERLLNINNH